MEQAELPYLTRLLDREDFWSALGDFDRLMEKADARLEEADGESEAVQAAKLMHEYARDHYHLMLVGQFKVGEIARGIRSATDTGNEIVLFNLARAFMEHTASMAYQIAALEKASGELPRKTNFKTFSETIARHHRKVKKLYYNEGANVHVNDMLKELASHYRSARGDYDRLCEFVHPNFGSNRLVSSGQLGKGQIRSHADELKDEVALAREAIETCAELVDSVFTRAISFLLGARFDSWIRIACQEGAKLSQVLTPRTAVSGDGKSKETALFFKKARTHEEALTGFYAYLQAQDLAMLSRETAAVEDGFLYDKVATDKGTLWVKYESPEL